MFRKTLLLTLSLPQQTSSNAVIKAAAVAGSASFRAAIDIADSAGFFFYILFFFFVIDAFALRHFELSLLPRETMTCNN